ncbi:Oligopeptide ABC transporter, periplasmic oligopeptide-binding protein [Bibersteinia trehalosi USDA-ARS-USMARC-190]|uniref:Oligopeptide ABC transporter, periplasmic oligopeptide-binding protein n=1 Tax=Bibersteinia trehalosi USDA-ARS-USMARC-190 TaxID=1263832 RepID=W0RBK3_BIBTR|nr:Oligopeptide ABC transporter, periplasmic oligopeptide-binding protein [Bibersteinia trehalosi USDA-ARS-USMARC-190]
MSSQTWAAKVPEGTLLAEKQQIVINNGAEPSSFDPHKTDGLPEAQISYQLLEGLVTKDSDGNEQPGMAVSWESSSDFKQWTFKLRPDAKWSNGEPVTAHDFVFSW